MSKTLIYQGKVFAPHKSDYALIIFPWVQLKRFLQSLYQALLRMMWKELLEGKKTEKDLTGILLFVLFCGLSWLSFLFKPVMVPLAILFLVIWYLDHGLARRDYLAHKYQRTVSLWQDEAGELDWRLAFSRRQPLERHFNWGQVRHLAIHSRTLQGGAFEDPLGQVWQVQLVLYDHSQWVLAEDQDLLSVLATAKQIQAYCDAPILFSGSTGFGPYAVIDVQAQLEAEQIPIYPGLQHLITPPLSQPPGGVQCRQTPQKWHIFSCWQWHHSWRLLKQIIRESGFLLFVLLASSFMIQWGGLINALIRSFQGQEPTVIDLRPVFGFSFLSFWPVLLSVGLAVLLLLYRGWQRSRVKHCFLDRYFLRFSLDNQALGKLSTQATQSILVLPGPEPQILLLADQEMLLLPPLPSEAESLCYAQWLQAGIDFFKGEGREN
ncbi:hypothetical protein [Synechocystis sp. LKSZ1]|uniref:hypothetical protein n=1 Tax=Synechocystis sp. LKSZ1 TaxID=3144951 RepID=UPI00336BFFB6